MKELLLIVMLLLNFGITNAQTVSIGYGNVLAHIKQTTKLIESKNPLQNTGGFFTFGYIHHLKKVDYFVSTSIYKGVTSFWYDEETFKGFEGSDVYRFDLGISYNLLNPKFWMYIKPYAGLGNQFTYKDKSQIGNYFQVHGPYYYQTNAPSSEGKSTFQIVPTAGIKLGFRLFKFIDICYNAQAVYAFKTYQKVNFDYTFYKDNPAIVRRAVFESTGTGIFRSVNIGIDLNAMTKKRKKRYHPYQCK